MPDAGSAALFISDLHLSPRRPAIAGAFLAFLACEVRRAGRLYILGDLFDYWIGDDDLADPFAGEIASAIAAAAAAGCAVHLMRGNRDFLMGERLCAAAGATLLEDPALVDAGGTTTLLMHGDTLCVDDLDYQDFRAKVRTREWQAGFLARPIQERRAIALGLRADSRESQRTKPAVIMDVAERAVVAAFQRFGCDRMIHGHTHRPARHEHLVDGRVCERWVLADWHETGSYLHSSGGAGCNPCRLSVTRR